MGCGKEGEGGIRSEEAVLRGIEEGLEGGERRNQEGGRR